ncbi:MAG: L,D-transpeptidase family protein [Betaproteobacteria bacterium]|nr:L,D-transpeptidase family protein [Betaproteobacteria bacterium]
MLPFVHGFPQMIMKLSRRFVAATRGLGLAAALSLVALKPAAADTFVLPTNGSNVVGKVQVVIATYKDTLPDIARRYDLGYREITQANPHVDPWLPGQGTRVVLPTRFILPNVPYKGIVVDIGEMRLFYFPKPKPGQPAVVITHPIGIGRMNWETPIGTTLVIRKIPNPVWHVPPSIQAEHAKEGFPLPDIVPAGPNNPLGQFALQLGIPGYLIHGTNKPYGVGMRVSHGCMHLYPEDIAALFKEVPVGTPVRLINAPYLAGWSDGKIYLAAHLPLEEQRKAWAGDMTPMVEAVMEAPHTAGTPIDWNKAIRVTKAALGIPIPISPNTPDTSAIIAAAPVIGAGPSGKPASEAQKTPGPYLAKNSGH